MAHRSRCSAPLRIHVLPVFLQSDARRERASIIRKPSVYAGENEPTAVYDAALSSVCQSKNRELFCFWLVLPTFCLILSAFPRFQPCFRSGWNPNSGRRFCRRLARSGVLRASTRGVARRKSRITSPAKFLLSAAEGARFASTPHCRHNNKSIAG